VSAHEPAGADDGDLHRLMIARSDGLQSSAATEIAKADGQED
jgi:hypothetical protein